VKITDVKLTVFDRPIGGDKREASVKGQSIMPLVAETVAVQIITDEGVTGEVLRMGGGRGLAHYLAATVKPALIGRDPIPREEIFQDLWTKDRLWFLPLFAIGTIDVALWDLYGKWVGRPIHELLGGYQTSMPVYASSMTKDSVEEFVEEALSYKDRGYHAYKLHCWGDPKRDVAACRAVREAVGDDYPLMLDVAAAYDQVDAMLVGRAIEELGFLWYEEPLRDYDVHGYRKLAAALDIPVCAGEVMEGSLYAITQHITSGAIDIVRADPSFKHGIGQTKKIAALAEAFGMRCEIHTNPNPVLDAAALQVALSISNTTYFEQLVPQRLFSAGVQTQLHIDSEGFVHAPTDPGLGMTIDWDLVERYKIAEL
jgi:L-alanine-DL-glutamate epimerase-like enolase superfamily enzyme